jgi:hypothetical protein
VRFPTGRADCESFFVWEGKGYLVTKVRDGEKAELFSFLLSNFDPVISLEPHGQLPVSDPVTSATLSSDGKQLALLTREELLLFNLELPFPPVKPTKSFVFKISDQKLEGCTFIEEGVLATSETSEIFLFPKP